MEMESMDGEVRPEENRRIGIGYRVVTDNGCDPPASVRDQEECNYSNLNDVESENGNDRSRPVSSIGEEGLNKSCPVEVADVCVERASENASERDGIAVDALSTSCKESSDLDCSGTASPDQVLVDIPVPIMEGITGGDISSSGKAATAENQIKTGNNSKKCLRVTFPDDSRVVSGYMDPPTPWHDASACTTEELVSAYQSACEKCSVKPLPKLLTQLQVITNFDDRNETLTLRGEHLDSKHCETLEEVFRRVQFRMVDLEATRLDEEAAVTVFDMVEYYESCIKLNISYNKNLNARGWQACARMMRKTPCLEQLEVRACSVTDQVMPFIGRSLRLGSPLTSLHLEATLISGRPLMILVASLKMNETLKELFLADNKLLPSDGIQLGSLLKYNRTLQLLDLRNNHLQDVGFGHISDGIWEQTTGTGLNTLVGWNNQLTYQSMSGLSRALFVIEYNKYCVVHRRGILGKSTYYDPFVARTVKTGMQNIGNTKRLETINLGHNNLTNEGIHRLKDGLLRNKSLMRIGLQAAKISCEGAVALAEFIAESPRLVRLDLRENEIKTGGLMALALSLKVSQSVTRIDLDKEPKKESSMKDFVEQQKRLLSDIATFMARNHGLARQREEVEMEREASETKRPASVDQSSDPQVRQCESMEATVESESSDVSQSTYSSDTTELTCDKITESDSLRETDGGVQYRQRLALSLSLPTRCQTLESPAFVRDSQMPDGNDESQTLSSIPEGADSERVQTRRIPIDLPPSPVVSAQGRTLLVPLLENALSPTEEQCLQREQLEARLGSNESIENKCDVLVAARDASSGSGPSSSETASSQVLQSSQRHKKRSFRVSKSILSPQDSQLSPTSSSSDTTPSPDVIQSSPYSTPNSFFPLDGTRVDYNLSNSVSDASASFLTDAMDNTNQQKLTDTTPITDTIFLSQPLPDLTDFSAPEFSLTTPGPPVSYMLSHEQIQDINNAVIDEHLESELDSTRESPSHLAELALQAENVQQSIQRPGTRTIHIEGGDEEHGQFEEGDNAAVDISSWLNGLCINTNVSLGLIDAHGTSITCDTAKDDVAASDGISNTRQSDTSQAVIL